MSGDPLGWCWVSPSGIVCHSVWHKSDTVSFADGQEKEPALQLNMRLQKPRQCLKTRCSFQHPGQLPESLRQRGYGARKARRQQFSPGQLLSNVSNKETDCFALAPGLQTPTQQNVICACGCSWLTYLTIAETIKFFLADNLTRISNNDRVLAKRLYYWIKGSSVLFFRRPLWKGDLHLNSEAQLLLIKKAVRRVGDEVIFTG